MCWHHSAVVFSRLFLHYVPHYIQPILLLRKFWATIEIQHFEMQLSVANLKGAVAAIHSPTKSLEAYVTIMCSLCMQVSILDL